MIRFIFHKAIKDYKVNRYTIKKGDNILKICFGERDVHKSRSGQLHLDIWGKKLAELVKSSDKQKGIIDNE